MTMTNMTLFLLVLISVESGGDNSAVGDSGRAVGCLQIWPAVVEDVNAHLGREAYQMDDRLSRGKSIEICRAYLDRYATAARLGHDPTWQDRALIWHYGPRGAWIADRHGYWRRWEEHRVVVDKHRRAGQ